ncbi:MAG: hypothetical protein AAFO06_14645 [Cyanobacteria bacterium J06597_16]
MTLNNTESNAGNNTDPREPNESQTQHINPGDKAMPSGASVEEKGEKTAVAYEDALGNPVEVPTYFTVEGEEGKKESLHHVKDAEEISDVIRQARVNEDGERTWR